MPSMTIEAVETFLGTIYPGHRITRSREFDTMAQRIELYDERLRNRIGIVRVSYEFCSDVMPEDVPRRLSRIDIPRVLSSQGEVLIKSS